MSMDREQQPTSTYDIITARATRLLIANPDRVRERVEQPGISLSLLQASDETMPSPAKFGYIHYGHDAAADNFWLSGRINFNPPENQKDAEPWQDELLEYVEATFLDSEAPVHYSPSHRSTLYVPLDEKFVAKITIEENTEHCGLVLEVENFAKLQRALGVPDKKPAGSDATTTDDTPRFVLVRDFLSQWNSVLSCITTLYGDEQSSVKDIIITVPELTLASQKSLDSSIPDAERVDTNTGALAGFDSIGGATQAKELLELMALAFKEPELAKEYGITPSSFLLHGPAGTGKTSLAKAFAHEIDAELREFSSTDIVDMYVGNSGKFIKKIFQDAKKVTKPLVLFFDEFDSIAPKGNVGTSERQQVKNVLKKELIDLHEHPHIIVAAATNCDMGDFDEALIRAGRLTPLYVAAPNRNERVDIWSIVLWKQISKLDAMPDVVVTTPRHRLYTPDEFHLYTNDVDSGVLADQSDGMTGADMEEILQRIQRRKFIARVKQGEMSPITQADILDEIRLYQKS